MRCRRSAGGAAEALAPGLAQARPVLGGTAQHLARTRPPPARGPAASPRRAGARAACSTRSGMPRASGSGRRRRSRSPQHRVHPVAGVVPAPPPRRGVHLLPRVDREPSREDLSLLAQDHVSSARSATPSRACAGSRRGKAPRSGSSLSASGWRLGTIAKGAGSSTRRVRLPARAQQRVVGPLVGSTSSPRRPVCSCRWGGLPRISLDTTKNYSFTYGTPIAAGGRERPMTPLTTTRVKTYGSAWNSTAVDSEKAGRRWASAVEKPNRQRAGQRAERPPAAEDHRRQRDEAAARGHLLVERAEQRRSTGTRRRAAARAPDAVTAR